MISDAPSTLYLASAQMIDAADVACLIAASSAGLGRVNFHGACPSSASPNTGYQALSRGYVDSSKGGPWSVERVTRLRELGFLYTRAIEVNRAEITREGRRIVRSIRATTRSAAEEGRRDTPNTPGESA